MLPLVTLVIYLGGMTIVAMALSDIEAVRRTMVPAHPLMRERTRSRRAIKVKLQKFFLKCLMPDGSVTILVVKAQTEMEASRKAHDGYMIDVVLDVLTEVQMKREWAKLKPSLIQRSQLK